MLLNLFDLFLLLLAGGWGYYAFQGIRVRELALQTARRACQEAGVQLLDQTVSLDRVSLSRDDNGRWRVWRQFRFEYSMEGEERQAGQITMLGMRVKGLLVAERNTLH